MQDEHGHGHGSHNGYGHSHGDERSADESQVSEGSDGKDQSPLRRTLAAQRSRLWQFKPRSLEGNIPEDR